MRCPGQLMAADHPHVAAVVEVSFKRILKVGSEQTRVMELSALVFLAFPDGACDGLGPERDANNLPNTLALRVSYGRVYEDRLHE